MTYARYRMYDNTNSHALSDSDAKSAIPVH